MEQIRAFIAIELSVETKSYLSVIQSTIKSIDPDIAKWVNTDNIHLTLKFLGNINPASINSINQNIQNVAFSNKAVNLNLGELGFFPDSKRIRVIWIGFKGELRGLIDIQKELDTRLSKIGFQIEKRSFNPHLTLARVYDNIDDTRRKSFFEQVISSIEIKDHVFEASRISLIKSELLRYGAVYTNISSFNLIS
jgi:RNA 2',3'-cyclic 3'-phosphodiesterase